MQRIDRRREEVAYKGLLPLFSIETPTEKVHLSSVSGCAGPKDNERRSEGAIRRFHLRRRHGVVDVRRDLPGRQAARERWDMTWPRLSSNVERA